MWMWAPNDAVTRSASPIDLHDNRSSREPKRVLKLRTEVSQDKRCRASSCHDFIRKEQILRWGGVSSLSSERRAQWQGVGQERRGAWGLDLPHRCWTWTPWMSINLSIITGGQAAPPIQQTFSMPLRLMLFVSQCSSRPPITVGTAAVADTLCSTIRSATDLPSNPGPEHCHTLVEGMYSQKTWRCTSLSRVTRHDPLSGPIRCEGLRSWHKPFKKQSRHQMCVSHSLAKTWARSPCIRFLESRNQR